MRQVLDPRQIIELAHTLGPQFVDRELVEQTTALLSVVNASGRMMFEHQQSGSIEETRKEDGSPVTNVDLKSRDIFQEGLPQIFDCPILSEETGYLDTVFADSSFLCLDELDGTSSLLGGYPNFGPEVAYVRNGELSIGVAGLPALNSTYFAIRGLGAFRLDTDTGEIEILRTRTGIDSEFRIAGFFGSQSLELQNLRSFLEPGNRPLVYQPVGALQKYCNLAEGKVDAAGGAVGLKLHDIAGAVLIVREAGGEMFDLETKKPVVIDPQRKTTFRVLGLAQNKDFKL